MNSGASTYRCLNCEFQYSQRVICPTCQKDSLRTESQIRSGGIILVLLGMFITAVLLGVVLLLAVVILANYKTAPAGKIIGGVLYIPLVLGISLFGISFVAEGFWRIATGRSSRKMIGWLRILAISLAVIGIILKLIYLLIYSL